MSAKRSPRYEKPKKYAGPSPRNKYVEWDIDTNSPYHYNCSRCGHPVDPPTGMQYEYKEIDFRVRLCPKCARIHEKEIEDHPEAFGQTPLRREVPAVRSEVLVEPPKSVANPGGAESVHRGTESRERPAVHPESPAPDPSGQGQLF